MHSERFLTGVNCWPRNKAKYWWTESAQAASERFKAIVSNQQQIRP